MKTDETTKTPLLLMAPGQTTTYQYDWEKPEERLASALGRRLGNGLLTIFAESKERPLHITDDLHDGELSIDVLLGSIQEHMRGDIESRTVTIRARRDAAGWRAAWRIARQVAGANPRTQVLLSPQDVSQVRAVEVPSYLFNSILVA